MEGVSLKRLFSLLIAISILFPSFLLFSSAEPNGEMQTYIKSKTINLVYDDSASMIYDGSAKVDTWCQAKYAMEVIAAMLGEKDVLNIFYMSDFDAKGQIASDNSGLTLRGADEIQTNVDKIHKKVTGCGDTPFNTVKEAYNSLINSQTDEKWLIVFTDGEFEDAPDDVRGELLEYARSDKKTGVIYLSIGKKAKVLEGDPENGFYTETADSENVLVKLTQLCNIVFENNEIKNNGSVTFDVSMKELVVFAQGKNVNITSITDADGKAYKPTKLVSVLSADKATDGSTNEDFKQFAAYIDAFNAPSTAGLSGCVATFSDGYKSGKYTIDISGASDVHVYYKPAVTVDAILCDANGEEVTTKNIEAGVYSVRYFLVDTFTNEKVESSELISNVKFEPSVINVVNGKETEILDVDQSINFDVVPDSLEIGVEATFLKYNTVSSVPKTFKVVGSGNLGAEVTENNHYILTPGGLINKESPFRIHVTAESPEGSGNFREISADEWSALEISDLDVKGDITVNVKKSDAAGDFEIYPDLYQSDVTKTDAGLISFSFYAKSVLGNSTVQGSVTGDFSVYYPQIVMQTINPVYHLSNVGFAESDEPFVLSYVLTDDKDTMDLTDDIAGKFGDYF